MKISYLKKNKSTFSDNDKNMDPIKSYEKSSFRFIDNSTMGHFSPNSSNVLDLEDRPSNFPDQKKINNKIPKQKNLDFSKKYNKSKKNTKYVNIVESIYLNNKNKNSYHFEESKNLYKMNKSKETRNIYELNNNKKKKSNLDSSKKQIHNSNYLEIKSEEITYSCESNNLENQLIQETKKNFKLEKENKNLIKELGKKKIELKKVKKLYKEEKEKFKKLHNILIKKEDNHYKKEYKNLEKKNNELLNSNHHLECKIINIKKSILKTSNLNNGLEKDFNLIKNQYTLNIKSKNKIIMELEKKNNILKKKLEILQKNNVNKILLKEIDCFSKRISEDISYSKNNLSKKFESNKKKHLKLGKNEQRRFSQKNYFVDSNRNSNDPYTSRTNKTTIGRNEYIY